MTNNQENNNRKESASMDPRTSRSAESRGHDSRESKERAPIVFGHISRFNIAPSVIEKLKEAGKIGGWVAYMGGNEALHVNYENAVDRGWEMADANDFPELCRQYEKSPFGKRETELGIKKGGQVFMIRDKELHDAESEFYDSENRYNKYVTDMHKNNNATPGNTVIDTHERNSRRR